MPENVFPPLDSATRVANIGLLVLPWFLRKMRWLHIQFVKDKSFVSMHRLVIRTKVCRVTESLEHLIVVEQVQGFLRPVWSGECNVRVQSSNLVGLGRESLNQQVQSILLV